VSAHGGKQCDKLIEYSIPAVNCAEDIKLGAISYEPSREAAVQAFAQSWHRGPPFRDVPGFFLF
jgi:hypothetical protein